ncbi:unnamed protein product [Arctia plantaginis]|uniref:E3 ubiquitin-protein ligase CHFR n=1 Tax=Arctia plantaginis TaxID=874455 RepID=A0A8S0YV87_ARCPL|nr:unnamed protein product [Arctia plantaginis]CAB3247729.1 unnamed protein product [Arctia plantaginis]
MGDGETCPVLISRKKLKSEFSDLQTIQITCDTFSLGRGLNNSLVIPYIAISRNHCLLKKDAQNGWMIEDNSSFGIKINGSLLGKGFSKKLSDGDVLTLEQTEEFVYEFKNQVEDVFEIPRKRIKLEEGNIDDSSIINNMKIKFEESQSHEIEHIEQKLKNVKHMQTTSMIITRQLHKEMTSRVKHLEADFTLQIENLKGEKNEIERQKAILLEERDAQLAVIKCEMEEKIGVLMKQVQKHNEAEIELMKENSSLKKKLEKEREEFLAELSRENSSKKDMLEKLEAKINEQEEVRAKERQEASELLHREVEKLKNIKEQQIKEIEEQKRQREAELKKELADIKDNLEEKVLQTEQEKLKAEQLLNEQLEKMKKLSDEEKIKIDELTKEREEIQQRLQEAQITAARSIQELTTRVTERETELAALAAERIQKQAEQSGEVISILQEQLEKVKNQLLMVETEKNTILENYCAPDNGEGSSKETLLNEVGEILESELQCSICAELFVAATILNCSHTFCKYCITMWKKKKKDCPICRAPIESECKSLVLDTFIEKMVQNLSEEMKEKRKNILKDREAEEIALMARTPNTPRTRTRRGRRNRNTRTSSRSITDTGVTVGTIATPTIPTVDLTIFPTQGVMPPLNLTRTPGPPAQNQERVVQLQILEQGVENSSRGYPVHIMVATDAATGVELAAIGRPAAPSQ